MKRFALLILFFCASAATAGEPVTVAVFNDRFVPPQRVEIGKLPKDIQAVWAWTADTPPHRVDVDSLGALKPLAPRWVSVRVEPIRKGEPLELVAAPVAMWEEVPEQLLPSYPVKEGLRIPVDGRSRWRVRVRGEKLGSWWTDVGPTGSSVRVTAVAAADRTLDVETEEQRGLAAVRLSIIDDGAERGDFRKLADYRTDEKGRVVMPAVPDSGAIVLVAATGDRAPKVLQTRPSSIPRHLTLPHGSTISGRLIDTYGLPVVHGDITVRTWSSELIPLPVLKSTVTKEDGTWKIGGLPNGKGEFEASATAFANLQRAITIAGDLDLGTIAMQPAVVADLLVIDDNGNAVSGAAINIGPQSATYTNVKGHASLAIAAGEPVKLRVTAPHHRAANATLEAPLPKVTKIVLQRAFRVSGRFVDANGAGIAEARARCKTGARLDSLEIAPDGHFDFDLEPAADYRIEFSSPTTAVATINVAKGLAGETRDVGDVVAPPSVTVRGRLLRQDQTPVAGARVWLPRPSEMGPLMAWAFRDILETTTRANGEFELSGAPSVPFVLRIVAPELAPARRAVTPTSDMAPIDVGDIVLAGGTTVTVRLDDGSGEDAVAHVDLGGAGISIDMLEASFVDGKAVVANVPPGPVIVSAIHGREVLCRQPFNVPADRSDVEFKCATHKVKVAGVVKVGGRPAGPGALVWGTPPPTIPAGIFTSGSGSFQQSRIFAPESQRETANVGTDGRFEGPALLPGAWDVVWMPDSGRMLGPRRMTVDDTTPALTLEYPGIAIEGVVLDAQRKPVKGADVRNVGGGGFSLSRDDGTFTLSGPEPGTWRVQARYRGEASRVTDVVVEADKQQPFVELVLGTDDTRVRVAAGAGAMVFLESDSGRIDLASTDASGVASFRVVPPLPQKVRVASSSAGRWTLGDWIAFEDATKGDVTLKPAGATGNVILRTKAASGTVTMTSADGWRIDRLLQWLGTFVRLAPESDVAISGLPPGTYSVSVANQQRTVSVEKEKTVDFVFE